MNPVLYNRLTATSGIQFGESSDTAIRVETQTLTHSAPEAVSLHVQDLANLHVESARTNMSFSSTPPSSRYVHFQRVLGTALMRTHVSLRLEQDFTAVCRVRFHGEVGSWESVFDFGNGAPLDNLSLARYQTTDRLFFRLYEGTSSNIGVQTTDGFIVQGEWMNVAVFVSTRQQKVYIYKNKIDTPDTVATYATTLSPRTTTSNRIGKSNWTTEEHSNLDLQGLLVYDRGLSPAEMETCWRVLEGSESEHALPPSPVVQMLPSELFFGDAFDRVREWDGFFPLTYNDMALTGNTVNPELLVSASSQLNNDPTYFIYRAFDKNTSTFWHSSFNVYDSTTGVYKGTVTTAFEGGSIAGEWVQWQFSAPNRLHTLKLVPRNDPIDVQDYRSPFHFTLLGSLDGTTWTFLQRYTNQKHWDVEGNVYAIALPDTAYSHYRLVTDRVGDPNATTQTYGKASVEFREIVVYTHLPVSSHPHVEEHHPYQLTFPISPLTGNDSHPSYRVSASNVYSVSEPPQSQPPSAKSITFTSPTYSYTGVTSQWTSNESALIGLFTLQLEGKNAVVTKVTHTTFFQRTGGTSTDYWHVFKNNTNGQWIASNRVASPPGTTVNVVTNPEVLQHVVSGHQYFYFIYGWSYLNTVNNKHTVTIEYISEDEGEASYSTYVRFERAPAHFLERADMSLGQTITIVTRFRFYGTVGNWERVFDFGLSTTANTRQFVLFRVGTTNKLGLSIVNDSGGAYAENLTYTIVQGEWMEVALTLSANHVALYVNDMVIPHYQVNTTSYIPLTYPYAYIARSRYTGDSAANLEMAGLVIYNRILTAREVGYVLNAMKASWTLDEYPIVPVYGLSYTFDALTTPGGVEVFYNSNAILTPRVLVENLPQTVLFDAWRAFTDRYTDLWWSTDISTDVMGRESGKYDARDGAYTGTTLTVFDESQTVMGEWIQFQFYDVYIPKIHMFRLFPREGYSSRNPREVSLLGSHDGIRWVRVHRETGLGVGEEWMYAPKTFSLATPQQYAYYRVVVESVGNQPVSDAWLGQHSVQLRRIEFVSEWTESDWHAYLPCPSVSPTPIVRDIYPRAPLTHNTSDPHFLVSSSASLVSDVPAIQVRRPVTNAEQFLVFHDLPLTGAFSILARFRFQGVYVAGERVFEFGTGNRTNLIRAYRTNDTLTVQAWNSTATATLFSYTSGNVAVTGQWIDFCLSYDPSSGFSLYLNDTTTPVYTNSVTTYAVQPLTAYLGQSFWRTSDTGEIDLLGCLVYNGTLDSTERRNAIDAILSRQLRPAFPRPSDILVASLLAEEQLKMYPFTDDSLPLYPTPYPSSSLEEWIHASNFSAIVTDGLAMHYDASHPLGVSGTTLTDLSGNGYHGTLEGGASIVDNRIVLNGGPQYVSTTLMPTLTGQRHYTYELWFRSSASGVVDANGNNLPNSNTALISNLRDISDRYAFLHLLMGDSTKNGGQLWTVEGEVGVYSEIRASEFVNICDGTWKHIVKTSDATSQTLYLNGVQIATTGRGSGTIASGQAFVIGGNHYDRYQTCELGPVRIYLDKALTPAEIQQNYTAFYAIVRDDQKTFHASRIRASATPAIVTDGLAMHYDVSHPLGVSGTTLTDLSGNGHHGALEGGASIVNNRIVLNGAPQYVSTTLMPTIAAKRQYTYELWFKDSTPGIVDANNNPLSNSNTALMSNLRDGSNRHAFIHIFSDGRVWIRERDEGAGDAAYTTTFSVCDGTWKHIVKSVDTLSQTLHVNGVQIATVGRWGDIVSAGQAIVIGGNHYGRYQTCELGPVRIYLDKALTSAEVLQNYNAFNQTTHIERSPFSPVPLFEKSSRTYWFSADTYTEGTGTYNGTQSTTYNQTESVAGEWLEWTPNVSILKRVQLFPYLTTHSPHTFTLLGSLDGTSWVLLGRETDLSGWNVGEGKVFSIPTTTRYYVFRLVVEQTMGGTYVALQQLKLFDTAEDIVSSAYPCFRAENATSSPRLVPDDTTWQAFDARSHDTWWFSHRVYDAEQGTYLSDKSTIYLRGGVSTESRGEWVQVNFADMQIPTLTGFYLTPHTPEHQPYRMTLVGSMDGTNWEYLASYKVQTDPFHPLPVKSAYRVYRVVVERVGEEYTQSSIPRDHVSIVRLEWVEETVFEERYGKPEWLAGGRVHVFYPETALWDNTSHPDVAVSASGEVQSFDAWQAFDVPRIDTYWQSLETYHDGTYTGSVTTSYNGGSVAGEWIQVAFKETPPALDGFRIYPRPLTDVTRYATLPTRCVVLGSMDGEMWTFLDRFMMSDWHDVGKSFRFASTLTYTHYRWVVERVGETGSRVQLRGLMLYRIDDVSFFYNYNNVQNRNSNAQLRLTYPDQPLKGDTHHPCFMVSASSGIASDGFQNDATRVWQSDSLYDQETGHYLGTRETPYRVGETTLQVLGEWLQICFSGHILPRIDGVHMFSHVLEHVHPASFMVLGGETEEEAFDLLAEYTSVERWEEYGCDYPFLSPTTYPYYRIVVRQLAPTPLLRPRTALGSSVAYPVNALSSNTSDPDFLVSASSAYTAGVLWDAWYAFNKTTTEPTWHTTEQYDFATGEYTGAQTSAYVGGSVSGEWIQLQTTSPIVLRSLTIVPRLNLEARSPRSFVLLGSVDGSTWHILFSVVSESAWTSAGKTYTLEVLEGYTYYRIAIPTTYPNITTTVQISQITMEASPYPRTRASNHYSGNFLSSLAFDGDVDTFWASAVVYDDSGNYTGSVTTSYNGGSVTGEWLEYRWGEESIPVVYKIRLLPRIVPENIQKYRSPRVFTLLGTNDEMGWEFVARFTGLESWTAEGYTLDIPTSQYMTYRLVVESVGTTDYINDTQYDRNTIQINEWVFLAKSPCRLGVYALGHADVYSMNPDEALYLSHQSAYTSSVVVETASSNTSSVRSVWHSETRYNTSGAYTGSASTAYTDGSVSGEWFQHQFTGTTIPYVDVLYLIPYPAYFSSNAPRDLTLLGSDNASTWRWLARYTGQTTWTESGNRFSLNDTYAYRYYRVVVESVGDASVSSVYPKTSVRMALVRWCGAQQLGVYHSTDTPSTPTGNVVEDSSLPYPLEFTTLSLSPGTASSLRGMVLQSDTGFPPRWALSGSMDGTQYEAIAEYTSSSLTKSVHVGFPELLAYAYYRLTPLSEQAFTLSRLGWVMPASIYHTHRSMGWGARDFQHTIPYARGNVVQEHAYHSANTNTIQNTVASKQAIWCSIPYTPRVRGSMCVLRVDADYAVAGNHADTYRVSIYYQNVLRFSKTQQWIQATSGGTRSGVLFPLLCTFRTTDTSAGNVDIRLSLTEGDDAITIHATSWSVIVTEML